VQGRDDGSKGGWKRIRLYRQSREGGHSEKRRGPVRLVTIYRSELGMDLFSFILQASNRTKYPMGMFPALVGRLVMQIRPGGVCACLDGQIRVGAHLYSYSTRVLTACAPPGSLATVQPVPSPALPPIHAMRTL
jgi:hypothetical protein